MTNNRSLGIDPGDVRIGVAMSDSLGMLAHPLETIDIRKTKAIPRLVELVGKNSISHIILGLPRNMDGSYGPAAEKSRTFADAIRAALPEVKVVLWDERLTTVAASRSLAEAGHDTRAQKTRIDQAAAQAILQGWLDSQAMLANPFDSI